MEKQQIGIVKHFFSAASVIVVELIDNLNVGDNLLVEGKKTSFEEIVDSIELSKEKINTANKGDQIGIKVSNPAKMGDCVYKIIE